MAEQQRQRLFGAFGRQEAPSGGAEQPPQRGQDVRLVVDNEDVHGISLPRRTGRGALTGRVGHFWNSRTRSRTPGMAASIWSAMVSNPDSSPNQGSSSGVPGVTEGS